MGRVLQMEVARVEKAELAVKVAAPAVTGASEAGGVALSTAGTAASAAAQVRRVAGAAGWRCRRRTRSRELRGGRWSIHNPDTRQRLSDCRATQPQYRDAKRTRTRRKRWVRRARCGPTRAARRASAAGTAGWG